MYHVHAPAAGQALLAGFSWGAGSRWGLLGRAEALWLADPFPPSWVYFWACLRCRCGPSHEHDEPPCPFCQGPRLENVVSLLSA
jgi:hypothetical protein